MNARFHVVAWAAAVLTAMTAHAQDMNELQELLGSHVVTAASQTAETDDTAPALASNITSADLRRYGIRTLEEAVNFLALGMSSGGRSFVGRAAELGARGVSIPGDQGSHVLLLLNGHQLNEPGVGFARIDRLAGIPLEMVDHIEVILGPGSVLYGNNAMLGVVNVVTKSAQDFSGVHVGAEGAMTPSVRASAGAGHTFTLGSTRGELTLALEYFERWGPKFDVTPQDLGTDAITGEPVRTRREGEADGLWGGRLNDSNFLRIPSGLARLRLGDFTLNLHGRVAQYGLVTRGTTNGPVAGSTFDDPDNWIDEQALWVDLRYDKVLSSVVDFMARAYADGFGVRQQTRENSAHACGGVLGPCRRQAIRTSRWAGLELRTTLDWLKDRSLVTLLGVDGRVRDARTTHDIYEESGGAVRRPSFGRLRIQDAVFGAYVQQIYRPIQRLSFNLGGRVDYDRRFDPVLTPRASVVAKLWRGGTGRVVYAEAFRAPGQIETNYANASFLRPDLSPEHVRSAEFSLDQRFGVHRMVAGGFWSHWSRLVGLAVLSDAEKAAILGEQVNETLERLDTVQLRNLERIDSVGLNAGYEASLLADDLAFGLNATLARSRVRGSDTQHAPPATPRLFGNARVRYRLPEPLPELALAAHYLARRPADHAFDGDYQPRPYAPPQLELRATASGQVGQTALSYRLMFGYLTASRGAYTFSPQRRANDRSSVATLDPIDQVELFGGLLYDF